jgi:hypothetical protein
MAKNEMRKPSSAIDHAGEYQHSILINRARIKPGVAMDKRV